MPKPLPAPMLPVAVASCAGLALGPGMSAPPAAALLGGLLVLALGCSSARWASLAVVVGWFLLGLGRGGLVPDDPGTDGQALWAVQLTGDGRDPDRRALPARLIAGWEALDRGERHLIWSGDQPVVLWLPAWPAGGPGRRGETWLARGRVRRGRGGLQLGVGRASRLHRVAPAGAWSRLEGRIDDGLVGLRRGAGAAIDRGAPPRLRPLFLALAVADRRALDPAMRTRLSRTGTAHLVALSGLHVGTALLSTAALARWILRRVVLRFGPLVAWSGRADVLALWVGLTAAVAYVAVAGAPTSARRALAMASAAVLAHSLGRRPSGWNTLALAAFCVAWIDPASVRSLGFQLSLASVGGLLASSSWGAGGGWAPWRHLRSAVLSSAAATLSTAPLLAHAFGQVPVASLWANPVAIPLLGVLTVPPLLVGSVLGSLSPALGAVLVRLASLPAGLGLDFVTWAGAPARSPMISWCPGGGVVLILYAAAGVILALGVRRG